VDRFRKLLDFSFYFRIFLKDRINFDPLILDRGDATREEYNIVENDLNSLARNRVGL
jgi:hypothetical protein